MDTVDQIDTLATTNTVDAMDTAFQDKISGVNVHLLIGGEPLNPATLRMYALSYANYLAKLPKRVYVDNFSNVAHNRVGKEVVCDVRSEPIGSMEDVLKKLRTDPFKEYTVMDGDTAKAAARVFAKEIALFERRGRRNYRAYPLQTNVQKVLNEVKDHTILPHNVIMHHPIGEGEFGFVYVGSCFGEIVAVKEFVETQIDRFKNEMKVALRLRHENIVDILGLCNEPDQLLVVMEFVGMSLHEALHVHKIQLDDDVKLDMMAQMFSGLDYLHKLEMAHCDIQPKNFLLKNIGEVEDIEVKLTDFGDVITHKTGPEFGPDGKMHVPKKRVPRYSAPEVLHGMAMTFTGLKAADVYSLAVTCFELSVEQTPFSNVRLDEDQLMRARRDDVWDSYLPSICVPVQIGRHDRLRWCWNRRPRLRPTAETMLVELDSIGDGDSIVE